METLKKYLNQVWEGDCLEIMQHFPDQSIDLVLSDLPYGITCNAWDAIIDFDRLWTLYSRIVKPHGAILLTGQGVFTGMLISSNFSMFKYKFVWIKASPTNFLNARKQPLRKHEDICVFYKEPPVYHPQMQKSQPYDKGASSNKRTSNYGEYNSKNRRVSKGLRYPTDVIFNDDGAPYHSEDWVYFRPAYSEDGISLHPCQKPISLGRYLVRTYSNEGDVVLDNACGSGSFLVAALMEKRNFIGIELNRLQRISPDKIIDCIELCNRRIQNATNNKNINPPLF